MHFDLNVAYTPHAADLQRTLTFLAELGYTTVAVNQTISGTIPSDLTPPPLPTIPSLRILSRLTVVLPLPNASPLTPGRAQILAQRYSLLALQPTDEKTLAQAIAFQDADLITLDLTRRLPFHLRPRHFAIAKARGVQIEVCYAPGAILPAGSSSDFPSGSAGSTQLKSSSATSGVPAAFAPPSHEARRTLLGNATGLVRALRGGRNLVLSSGATRALGCRAPADVINMATLWGLSREWGVEATIRGPRRVIAHAELRRRGWRGVIDFVDVGSSDSLDNHSPMQTRLQGKATQDQVAGSQNQARAPPNQVGGAQKRSLVTLAGKDGKRSQTAAGLSTDGIDGDAPMSKRQKKRLAHLARVQAGTAGPRGGQAQDTESRGEHAPDAVPSDVPSDTNLQDAPPDEEG